jgi:lipoprotein-anchoring transpeptidase ErfK/SrfK
VRRAGVILAVGGIALLLASDALAFRPKLPFDPGPPRIAAGVTVAGIRVGKMRQAPAEAKVRRLVLRAFQVRAGNLRRWVRPKQLGLVAYVKPAVASAMYAEPGTSLKLLVEVRAGPARRYVNTLSRRFYRPAIDSHLTWRGIEPYVTPGRPGREIDRAKALASIVYNLRHNVRLPVNLPVIRTEQRVTRSEIGPVVVIRRGSNELHLYDGMKPWRTFQVATGQSSYPTPLGHWQIVEMWRYPWWYPPNSAWAQGLKPVPPGPGNPLGTRWMGLSASAVGIHGTPDDGSVGYSASHGCIRMHIWEAEWLFERVHIGTPVFIVSQ